MSFAAPKFTNAGRNLQLKALAGTQLNFTKIQMGDGYLTTQAPSALTSLINPLVDIEISNFKRGVDYVTVGGTFTNSTIKTGFYWREIGLFVNDPDEGEILYCYQNAYDLAEYISAAGSEIIEKSINISAVVGNAQNISETINESLVFATVDDLQNHSHNLANGDIPGFSQNNFSNMDKEKIENVLKKDLSNVTGTLSISNGGTGATTVNDAKNNLGLGSTSSPQFLGVELYHNTPFVDFHYNNTSDDYNIRIINDADKNLSITAGGNASLKIEGNKVYTTADSINADTVDGYHANSFSKIGQLHQAGQGLYNGYSFQNDGAFNTGMFSESDDDLKLIVGSNVAMYSHNGRLVFPNGTVYVQSEQPNAPDNSLWAW